MRLAELVSQEFGAELSHIMLLRHFNDIDKLLEMGGSIEEFTSLQPTGTKWDFWADGKPRIEIVVVIIRDIVFGVYRIDGVEQEGTIDSLSDEPHLRFDRELKRRTSDLPARRFRMSRLSSNATNATVTGWRGREISPVLRSNGHLFWEIEVDAIPLAEEVAEPEGLYEGALRRISVNAYERNPAARAKCVAHYGTVCQACGTDFGSSYGPIADGFIHVHHLKPLSEIGCEYEVDPIGDLRPVCPNCHAVIHLGGGCRSIEEVKQLLADRGGE